MKNVKMLLAVVMLGTATVGLSSCGKYEEGPGMSLLTKKMRITGEWDLKETVEPDGDVDADNSSDYVTFDKDGTWTYTSGSVSQKGEWAFSSGKEKLKVSYPFGGVTVNSESTIIRLTNKEMWLKDGDGYISKSEKR